LGAADELEAEAAALRISRSCGLDAPTVVATVPLTGDAEAGDGGSRAGAWALVTTRPGGVGYPALLPANLAHLEELFAGFARHQAALHDRTEAPGRPERDVDDPEPPDLDRRRTALPRLDLAAEMDRIDAGRFAAELGWLRAHAPEPGPEVVCHGAYEMNAVHGPGPEAWDRWGGPGRGLTVTNWFNAVRAEREYDVGLTLVTFWVAPLFVEHRPARAPLRMMRNNLASSYRRAYREVAALDPVRLSFWQAFHAVRGMAEAAGAYRSPRSAFRRTDPDVLPKGLGKELARLHRMVTARAERGG
jgi:aminoglycoside phosphotransferase (APT) family kinase protein